MSFKVAKEKKGITLIALAITIIVLLILAGVTIATLTEDNGILKRAKEAKEDTEIAEEKEQQILNQYEQMINANIGERTLVTLINYTNHDNILAKDIKGNPITIPGGFKISDESGETVQQGIVIEDENGNQFVWIPVSNINHDGSNKIILDNGTEKEITLGRYTFSNSSPSLETLEQPAIDYIEEIPIESTKVELVEFREADQSSDTSTINATAKNLKKFIDSANENNGYYIARYEASYGSGSEFGVGNNSNYYKPLSKKTSKANTNSMNYEEGTLWNFITQGEASMVSRQMYYDNNYIESDLINSYAWDTTLLYIQIMSDDDYANTLDGNGILRNTGDISINDQRCRIFDLSGNCREWTTEHGNGKDSGGVYPCVDRGSSCQHGNKTTSTRTTAAQITNKNYFISFRVQLYIK